MSRHLLPPQRKLLEAEFSIGICAADRGTNIKELLDFVETETYPKDFVLNEVVIVASALAPRVLALIREFAKNHEKYILIEEPIRLGKSEAINRIVDSFTGQFLVLVNSDAHPETGAISKLLTTISSDDHVGVASASPVVAKDAGFTGSILQLIWEVHNECLLTLNEENKNNHCCDELIVIRAQAIQNLPADTVNDGAYLAGAAHRAGYSIRFCENARVRIDVPHRFCDLIRQRRRIVYGHLQILKSVGEAPRTVESMLFDVPLLSFLILTRTIAQNPRLALALPFAIVGEAVSLALAVSDNLSSTKKHVPWVRVGSRG